MKKTFSMGQDFNVDLQSLLATRLLIAANSGGGKSYALRRLLEQTNGQVQQLVIDLEGEFYSLRDKFDDYILIGKDGDLRADVRAAGMLATKLLELGSSAIIDLSELKFHERKHFVRLFIESMMEAPEDLWRPVLVIIDEAHHYAPQVGENEATAAVIDLMTRGRKRGFCGVLATQRISKLHKDAIGECNNKMFGRTSQDIDMKRTADELGFTTRAQMFELRGLLPGHFFAFGPAISSDVELRTVGAVQTATARKTGSIRHFGKPTPAMRAMLAKLADLPQKAEEEAKTVVGLQRQLREAQAAARAVPAPVAPKEALPMGVSKWREYGKQYGYYEYFETQIKQAAGLEWEKIVKAWRDYAHGAVFPLKTLVDKIDARPTPAELPPNWMTPSNIIKVPVAPGAEIKKGELVVMTPEGARSARDGVALYSPSHEPGFAERMEAPMDGSPLKAGARKTLHMLVIRHPNRVTKAQLGVLTGFKPSGGTFGTYISKLKGMNLIDEQAGSYGVTAEGLAYPLDEGVPQTPEERLEMWNSRLKAGARAMLAEIVKEYPGSITRAEIGARLNMIPTGGTFGTYIGHMKSMGIITVNGQELRASDDVML